MSKNLQDPILTVEGLNVHFGALSSRKQVLREVSFTLRPGQALGVVGETGSGKTTVARAILGLVKASSGRIQVNGYDIQRLNNAELKKFRKRGEIQYVFQDPLRSLDPDRTLGQSIAEPLQVRSGVTKKEIYRRSVELLEQVDLDPDLLSRYPSEVSGGQRQRVAIARALITTPRLIILDEPVSALDAPNRSRVLKILSQLRDSGVALLFISHDLGSVAGLTDELLVLYRGEVKELGTTADTIRSPRHAYTKLLVGSAPRMNGAPLGIDERRHLRQEMEASA